MQNATAHPLHALAGLTAAVVGSDGAGKSALVAALAALSGAPAPPPPRPPAAPAAPAAAPPLLLSHVLRSAPLRFLRFHAGRFARALRSARARGACVKHVLATGGAPLTVFEAVGGAGVSALRDVRSAHHIDVVLFVTRLDDGRVVADDRITLARLARVLGPAVLDRTLFVLTHGCAKPPHGLSFAQFVRGTRDLLWGHIKHLVPPAPDGVPHRVVEPSFRDPLVTPVPADLFTDPGVVFEHRFRAPWARRPAPQEGDQAPEQARGADDPGATHTANGSMGLAPARRIADVNVSLPPEEQFAWLDSPLPGEDHAEYARFREPPPPVVAVVELSGRCPVDAHGARVLPDGMAWEPALVAAVARRAVRASPAELSAIQGAVEEQATMGPWRRLWRRVMETLDDSRVLILLEMALGSLLVNIILRLNKMRVDAKRVATGQDLVLRISDEQYERLTEQDPDGGMAVLSLDGGDGGRDKLKFDEGELFGSLEEAEEDFFGPKEGSVGPNAGDVTEGGDAPDEKGGHGELDSATSAPLPSPSSSRSR